MFFDYPKYSKITAPLVSSNGVFNQNRSTNFIPSKTQMSYFKIADEISKLSDHPQACLGCVLVDRHRIISSGTNSYTKCDPLQREMDSARFGTAHNCRGPVHAETACLLPLIKQGADLSRSDLYIIRRHKNTTLALSRPCAGCMSLLRASGVRRVYYSTEEGYAFERIN